MYNYINRSRSWSRSRGKMARLRNPDDTYLPSRNTPASPLHALEIELGCDDKCELPGKDVHVPVQGGDPVSVAGHGAHDLGMGHVPQLHGPLAVPYCEHIPLLKC